MNPSRTLLLRGAARALTVALGLLWLAACTNPFQPTGAAWQVEPGELRFTGVAGAAAPSQQTFTLRNAGSGAATFLLTPSSSWIVLEPSSGRLAPGAGLEVRVGVEPCTGPDLRAGLIEVTGSGDRASVRVERACEPATPPPSAQLTASPRQGPAPLEVRFERTAASEGGSALTCRLDFGDGAEADSACNGPVVHTYTQPGGYTAVFSVSDGTTTTEASVAIAVGAASAPTWVLSPDRVTFDAPVGGSAPDPQTVRLQNAGGAAGRFSASSDRDWLTVSPASGDLEAGSGRNLVFSSAACDRAGSDTATVTVAGGGSQATARVVRNCASPDNRDPSAGLSATPERGPAPLTVTFGTSATDPDGDALSCSLDFGDGSSTTPTCGDSVGHTYASSGSYTAKLIVRDGQGGVGEARATITVEAPNRAPSAALSADPTSGAAPLGVTFTLDGSDPDGDALSCSLDFGDGNQTAACSGSVSHTYDREGNYQAVFQVDDGRGGSATSRVTVRVVKAGSPQRFDIQLLFVHEPTDPDVRAAFEDAAAHWERVITGDLRDVQANVAAGRCIEGDPGYQGPVDDLLIVADVVPIDGNYGILGSAGPCYVRGGSGSADYYLPFYGGMRFDEADMDRMKQNGTLESVILHEMGHVLGLGTLWKAGPFDYLNYDAASCQSSNEITYDGAHAMDAYHALGTVGEVPVENTGGSGTKCGHWREATFDTELMTGWIDGANAPLSRVTVGSLDDLGYAVDYAQADAYALPTGNVGTLGGGEPLEETLIFPSPPAP